MDSIEKAAFIIAQATCAQVEAIGMQSANQTRIANGEPPRYTEQDFLDLQMKYLIGHNAVIEFMRGY